MPVSAPPKPKDDVRILRPRIPDGFRTAVGKEMIQQTQEWLDRQKGATSLGLLLRMDRDLAELSPDDPGWRDAVRRGARKQIEQVRWSMHYAVPRESRWREAVTEYPAIHCCAVRGPIEYLKKFLKSDLFSKRDDVVGGILLNDPMRIPEYAMEQAPYDGESQREEVERLLRRLAESPEDFLHDLGITNDPERWKNVKGNGQCVCVLDSGVDESHPGLQRSVRAHALYDSYGHYKEAKYAFDHGCHGTKTSGLIVARNTSGFDLGHDIAASVPLGVAPEAQVVMVNVLQGDCRQEVGELEQFLAGIDWAVEHQHHPQFGGYEVVSISIEVHTLFAPQVNKLVDDILDFMRACRLVPLLAAGNRGPQSTPLGTRGAYVGACDRGGNPWPQNGPAHLLAPGVSVLCCQPAVSQLTKHLLGIHTGTSMATAVAAGAILLLGNASHRSAGACLTALVQTSGRHREISLDSALNYLEFTSVVPDFDPDAFPL